MRSTPRGEHVAALDGLRGLAALIVVVRHTLNAVAIPDGVREAILRGPLAVFLNAEGAVQVFFVLSGYVLAGSLERRGGFGAVAQYLVRRVFRIHPPYVAAVLLSWLLAFLYAAAPGGDALTQWQRHMMAVHLPLRELAATLLFPGDAHLQLPVGWTLQVEMIFSLLLPLMVVAAGWLRGVPLLAVALAALMVDGVPRWMDHALDFSFGVLTFRERAALARLVPTRGWAPPLLALVAVCVHTLPLFAGWLMPWGGLLLIRHGELPIAVMSVGAWMLLLSALFLPGPRRLLSRPAFVDAGRWSYSLYLVHLPVLQAVLWAWGPTEPLGAASTIALMALVLGLTVALARVGWRLVERPSILAGNAICRWLSLRLRSDTVPSALASR